VAKSRKNIKPNNGVKLYNKILKEFTKVNDSLPEDRKLSLAERRKYISEKIYPQFKGTSSSKVGVKIIRENIDGVLDSIIPKEGCDPNIISPSVYADVNWFDLDEFIRDVLPKCIFIRVDADTSGKTKIFNTLNYDYNRSGVRNIIDKLRLEVKNTSSASFTGVKKLKPNKTNDGTPENYFIDFVLVINNVPTSSINPISYTLSSTQKKQVTSVRNAILSRVKDVSNKKKRRKNARKNAIKNIGEIKKKNKRLQKAKSPNFKKRLGFERLKEFLKAKKQIQTALNRGNLTQEQFDRFNAELDKLIDQIKKQGGIV
jgi:hypothetical protein